jgi:crotonobetainyl-CoA:carnitine CoA-transferase CaiB-like acyl-CoA transferase
MLLADLGADVIKIEKPEQGDPMRRLAPHTFEAVNRNKRSMVLNLKQREGQRVFRKIAVSADVIVESYRPGVAEKLGVGYHAIRDVNPGIIYCSITGYGQEGPYRNRQGRDINYLGIAGLLGSAGEDRTGPKLPISQLSSALFAALSILTAFITRGKTGEGQYIDVAMTDGLLSWTGICSYDPEDGKRQEEPGGISRPHGYDATFSTSEGERIAVGVADEAEWRKLCNALRPDDLAGSGAAAGRGEAGINGEMRKELQARFWEKSRDQWIEILEEAGVTCGPVYSYSEASSDAHLRDRKLFVTIQYRGTERLTLVRFPVKSSNYRPTIYFPPPELGEHTEDLLTGVGFTDSDIERLRERGVFGLVSPE